MATFVALVSSLAGEIMEFDPTRTKSATQLLDSGFRRVLTGLTYPDALAVDAGRNRT
jgi:hypothetical protein